MANESLDSSTPNAKQDLAKLREVLLGKDQALIKQVLQENARDVVADVVVEALHDRQHKDDSVNSVFVPLVEQSVEKSVSSHSDQFIGYLYPLVGRLVRKSVSAFLSEFLEKTNQLIENSFTVKGIAWRIKAWQAGLSFSQYVASRTFVFRVEQVLLIHAETGLLVNSVSREASGNADADLVSGMLTAINDFVNDSFSQDSTDDEENLEVVKTESFTLVIKRGPSLVLVAAMTGNIPHGVSTTLQITNETIHKLFVNEIAAFSGDNDAFEGTTQHLQSCLLSEVRPESENKRPIFAIIFMFVLFILLSGFGVTKYQQNTLLTHINNINQESGIIVKNVNATGWDSAALSVLRDPDAISVEQWLEQQNIPLDKVVIHEKSFLSLDQDIVYARLRKAIASYPEIHMRWSGTTPELVGVLANRQRIELMATLRAIPGLNNLSRLTQYVNTAELSDTSDDNPELLNAMFNIGAARIDSTQIEFAASSSELTELAKQQLDILASHVTNSITLAKKLELNVGLIIMGASDSSGSATFNQALSLKRAQSAQAYLVSLGIEQGYLNAVGLGVVELKSTGAGARKVIFNIVNFKTDQ